MSEKLCLVEDDPTISELVCQKLQSSGYQVDTFDNATDVLEKVSSQSPWDLYILDIRLRGKTTGLELCASLREKFPLAPILILSALSEPSDRIEGLKQGADDYLTKPFQMEELLLRIRGMLARRGWYRSLPENEGVFRWADNEINFESFEAKCGDKNFVLSQKECMLMKLLIERKGQVVHRDDILNQVWGYDVYPSSRTVDNFILKLRKHFESTPNKPQFIHSVRGVGYKFTPGDET